MSENTGSESVVSDSAKPHGGHAGDGGLKASLVGEYRTAEVVKVVSYDLELTANYGRPSRCNLQVKLDGPNDNLDPSSARLSIWLSSRSEGTEPGTWMWPPRV